jgi:hypothetical protein
LSLKQSFERDSNETPQGGTMVKNDALREPETIDGATLKVVTIPERARDRLDTALDVRRANARVFRAMRTGKLDVTAGAKLSFVLMNQLRMIELSDLEKRIEQLETFHGENGDLPRLP